jgi:hypothetical protein
MLQVYDKNGGRAGTRTPDLLRVKDGHQFQSVHQFVPVPIVSNDLQSLLFAWRSTSAPSPDRVLAQF